MIANHKLPLRTAKDHPSDGWAPDCFRAVVEDDLRLTTFVPRQNEIRHGGYLDFSLRLFDVSKFHRLTFSLAA
jgi:hypothetical protein